MSLHRPLLVGAIVLASLGSAAPVHAGGGGGYAYINGSTLLYLADLGVANRVGIWAYGDDAYAIDDVQPIDVGPGCSRLGPDLTVAACSRAGITMVRIDTYDLDDFASFAGPAAATIRGGVGNDTLWTTSPETNSLFGGPGNDNIGGYGGDDWLIGGTGTDHLSGGGGTDTVSYMDSPVGVSVDLDLVDDDGAPGENDVIAADIENLVGSPYDDTLRGSDTDNEIYGGPGDDVLYGRGGDDDLYGDGPTPSGVIGADFFFGGPGIDRVSYADHTAAQRVFADLDIAIADDGAVGEGDSIAADVEALTGSPGSDFLTGNAEYNWFSGGDGNDVITALDGNDVAHGEAGNDTIYGGDGDDLLKGGNGDDNLYGQRGSDFLDGWNGTDTCDVSAEDRYIRSCE